jgi:arylformamidase
MSWTNTGYDIDTNTPDMPGKLARFHAESVAAREKLTMRTIRYGAEELAVADCFEPEGPVRGTVVFVHGGYWRAAGRPDRAFLAPEWNAIGVRWVNLGYPVAPATPLGRIAALTSDALHAIIAGEAPFGGMEGPLVLTGNSAGGHLLAHALVPPLPLGVARLRGAMLLSGLYDLRPLVKEACNDWLHLDAASAARYSPTLLPVPQITAPIMVAVGGEEPEAFTAQSRDYAAHIGRTHDEIPGLDHMTMISALRSPKESLGKVVAGWLAV